MKEGRKLGTRGDVITNCFREYYRDLVAGLETRLGELAP